jgi:23S rRNA (cytosine1962-C5)-methyltransferase
VAIIHTDRFGPLPRAEIEPLCSTAYLKIHPRSGREYVARDEPVWGPPREEVVVTEHGVRYLVKPTAGLTVGLFLDMREVRQWLRTASAEKTVLNLFAYTCSLGVCAALGGASRVVNLDLSRPYLEWGKANYALNDLAVDPRDFIYGDAFDWLGRFARRSQRFDLVIVDPPSFSSTPFSVTRDYPRLAAAAARVVSPGGILLASTNHAQTTEERFSTWLDEGLADAQRRGETMMVWHEPKEDFPVPRGERPYLKVRALQLRA